MGKKKRATFLATLVQNELNSDVAHLLPTFEPVRLQVFFAGVINHATSLFSSLYSNVAKKVVGFLLSVLPSVK